MWNEEEQRRDRVRGGIEFRHMLWTAVLGYPWLFLRGGHELAPYLYFLAAFWVALRILTDRWTRRWDEDLWQMRAAHGLAIAPLILAGSWWGLSMTHTGGVISLPFVLTLCVTMTFVSRATVGSRHRAWVLRTAAVVWAAAAVGVLLRLAPLVISDTDGLRGTLALVIGGICGWQALQFMTAPPADKPADNLAPASPASPAAD